MSDKPRPPSKKAKREARAENAKAMQQRALEKLSAAYERSKN